jgi:Cache domain
MSGAARLLADVTRRMDEVLGSVAGLVTAAESIAGRAGRVPANQPPDGPVPANQPPGSEPPGTRSLRRDDFAALRPLVAALLEDHAGLAAGAGVVLAPQMLADAPRCIEWWWTDRNGRVVPLDVDTDPESAEFYDYTTTEWYREPERTGAATLAGPYVDFICTHEYTFTLAAPVRSAGRFIGVAATDILATQVERLVLPGLCRLGTPAGGHAVVLASGHGRVIASTSASLPPGAALPRLPQASGCATLAGPGEGPAPRLLPWSLLTVPTA